MGAKEKGGRSRPVGVPRPGPCSAGFSTDRNAGWGSVRRGLIWAGF